MRSEVRHQIKNLFLWFRDAALLTSGGWLTLCAWIWLTPFDELVHLSRGLIGVPVGITFIIGTAVSCIVYWVITGRSGMDRLTGLERRRDII